MEGGVREGGGPGRGREGEEEGYEGRVVKSQVIKVHTTPIQQLVCVDIR